MQTLPGTQEHPLLRLANEALQRQNPALQVQLAIAFPGEIAIKGYDAYFNNGQGQAVRAVFQLVESIANEQEIICQHSEWDRFLDEVQEELGTRFVKAARLDRLRQNKNRNRDD